LIEDIVEAQALSSLRQFYTDDAGYSLGRQVDTDLVNLGQQFNVSTAGAGNFRYAGAFIGGDGSTAFDYTANTNAGNASALTAAGIRRTIQRLDDSDVPMDNRFFLIPPNVRNTILGLTEFTTFNSVGEAGSANSIRNGMIGDIYGVPVYVSSNAGTAKSAADGTGTSLGRVCLMAHKDSMVLVEQVGVRSQTQYKQEYLGTLFTADTLYGCAELRNYGGVALVVPV
jgi:N4-gp56 family major capsid protein